MHILATSPSRVGGASALQKPESIGFGKPGLSFEDVLKGALDTTAIVKVEEESVRFEKPTIDWWIKQDEEEEKSEEEMKALETMGATAKPAFLEPIGGLKKLTEEEKADFLKNMELEGMDANLIAAFKGVFNKNLDSRTESDFAYLLANR